MANLPEVAQWTQEEDAIYQFELDDYITGGPGGNDNEPHRLLANRTRFLKKRQEALLDSVENLEYSNYGLKNLWIDGSFRFNFDGVGEDYAYPDPSSYTSVMTQLRGHSNSVNNAGVYGSVFRWDIVHDISTNWFKVSHVGAEQMSYIAQLWESAVLQNMAGKKVTVSFDYICSMDMIGEVALAYGFGNSTLPGSATHLGADAYASFNFVGDNKKHRVSVTLDCPSINIIPTIHDFVKCYISYGAEYVSPDNPTQGIGAVPDGFVMFSNIQVEIAKNQTQYIETHPSLELNRILRYYNKIQTAYSYSYDNGRMIELHFPVPMRIPPQITYDTLTDNASIQSAWATNNMCRFFLNTSIDKAQITNLVLDSRIYYLEENA